MEPNAADFINGNEASDRTSVLTKSLQKGIMCFTAT